MAQRKVFLDSDRKFILLFHLFSLTAILLLIISCQPQGAKTAENITDALSETTPKGCIAHSECIDENYLRLQAENCSWSKPERCDRGCFNASCRPAEICTVGFRCIDEDRRGYQKEDCSFATKVDCEWGCDAGKCKEKPANATNAASTINDTAASGSGYSAIAENAEENETVPEGPRYTLQLGEEGPIEIDGTIHILKIHNIEVDRVIIKVDDIKSDWIAEGGSFTYSNLETTITIKSILFQAYGKKEIEYSIS
mgnify:CR=1 FL=1